MEKIFNIRNANNSIVLEKDDQSIVINQSVDDDIWFHIFEDTTTIELDLSSENYVENKVYMIFEFLIKSIIGKYILSDDYKSEYSGLPKDFIDFENKTIIWHSDASIDNVLKLEYQNNIIKISVFKDSEEKTHSKNSVRISMNGSNYDSYYHEFLEFYTQLWILVDLLSKNEMAFSAKEDSSILKGLYLNKKTNKID